MAEQVFDRRSAVKLYRIFAAEHGGVNPDTSHCETGCDRSLVPKPCYTAPGSVLCRNLSTGDHAPPPMSPAIQGLDETRFLEQVANACRVKRLAYRTEQSYVAWVRRFKPGLGVRSPLDA